jgi:hypothetical protein
MGNIVIVYEITGWKNLARPGSATGATGATALKHNFSSFIIEKSFFDSIKYKYLSFMVNKKKLGN